MSDAIVALQAQRAELAALESQAIPIRADIILGAAIAILRGGAVPRMRGQRRPEWFGNLGP